MKLGVSKLSTAVRLALSLGAVIAVGASGTAFAQDAGTQDAANQPSQKKASTLETVVVTGSRIRRVDLETSSPVLTIDRAQIQASGKQTLGDLVQQIPAIAGAATNPNVNNGGGNGASTVSLRGLGSNRTLILVNGHRVLNNDINSIPASMVERIEVLKDGASATYGSDAIGGVVNFILRNDFQGAQISANYGESDHSDGAQRGFAATFGTSSDKGNIVAGIDYNKFDAISSANRDYSKYATYLYSGSIFNAGSSRNPNGQATLSDGSKLTLANPVPGKTTVGDYRPYDGRTDAYNYAAHNLIQTPQERTNVFALANYNLTDNVSAYFDAFYNKTTSNAALAALPFDANSDGVTISKDNYYNPFGQDFGPGTIGAGDANLGTVRSDGSVVAVGDPSAYNYVSRFTNLGQRVLHYSTTTGQVVAGLKGNFGADSSWQWFGDLNYGHQTTQQQSPGYVYYNGLKSALGPSFMDTDGVVKCGSAGNVIAGCTPVNIFNLNDPATTAALKSFAAAPFYHTLQTSRRAEIGANGSLFDLPAGTAQLAVGASYDKEYQNYQVDLIAQTTGDDGTCFISQEACSTPLNGSFTDKEAYFELFVPVLADLPMVKSLNVTIGSRFSKYNTAGSSWNQKFGVEWRPFDDLLVRGTVAGVFRAPNINELYAGAQGSAPQVIDPCVHLTGAQLAAHPTACKFVPVNWDGADNSQTTGVISGSVAAGIDLKPEHGKSYDYGFVYDPSFAPGLSVSADLWRVTLDDTITPIAAQTVVSSCFANESSPFCSLLHRNVSGDFSFISQPTVNLGKLNTKGVDGSIKYKIPHFDVFGQNYGDLTASLDATYLTRYDNDTAPGQPGDVIVHMAGHYNNQYGNYTRWRGLGQLNWTNGPWNVNYTMRYIGAVTVGWDDLREGVSADPNGPERELKAKQQIYHNLAIGYNLAAYHTRLDVGVNNLFDKQPPLMYQNNVLNSNTDINTYEPIGRYFWGRVTVTF